MEGTPDNQAKNALEIKRSTYLELINDFGLLTGLNTVHFGQHFLPGNERAVQEFLDSFKKPSINGKSYHDFVFGLTQQQLVSPQVSKVLVEQIYHQLKFIEARIGLLRPESNWVKRFYQVRDRYASVVSSVA